METSERALIAWSQFTLEKGQLESTKRFFHLMENCKLDIMGLTSAADLVVFNFPEESSMS